MKKLLLSLLLVLVCGFAKSQTQAVSPVSKEEVKKRIVEEINSGKRTQQIEKLKQLIKMMLNQTFHDDLLKELKTAKVADEKAEEMVQSVFEEIADAYIKEQLPDDMAELSCEMMDSLTHKAGGQKTAEGSKDYQQKGLYKICQVLGDMNKPAVKAKMNKEKQPLIQAKLSGGTANITRAKCSKAYRDNFMSVYNRMIGQSAESMKALIMESMKASGLNEDQATVVTELMLQYQLEYVLRECVGKITEEEMQEAASDQTVSQIPDAVKTASDFASKLTSKFSSWLMQQSMDRFLAKPGHE